MSKSQFVDFRAVKREVSIVQVLEHYDLMSKLHRNGDSLTGTCPIHGGDNKTAFRASVSKNCWNCFSRCGCGGNVLDFVAKKEKVSILQAANLLVEWFHLPIDSLKPEDEETAPPRATSRAPQPEAKASTLAAKPAPAKPETETGENKPLGFTLDHLQADHPYLAERGLTPATVQSFGLGYCAKGLHKGRIAIPIHNAKGELIAYAGRAVSADAENKYLFPNGFKKSLELFNLHRALTQSADQPLIIVEGFFPCLKLWQHGAKRIVALMGSSLSAAQEELIRRHFNSRTRVVVMLDEDEAGRTGREDIARRLAPWLFVKVHWFEKMGTQPDDLTADEIQELFGGVP